MYSSLLKNKSGFSLTEVMIGIMILTIAIVAASSLLVGLVRTNENNLRTMQAYYFAQEGIEGVRNIRDTNWLHNRDWRGGASDAIWSGQLTDGDHPLTLRTTTFNQPISDNLADIQAYAPWTLSGDNKIIDAVGNETGFSRTVTIKPYPCTADACVSGHDNDYILIESNVAWAIGSQEHEVTLFEVLTNWKGGAL